MSPSPTFAQATKVWARIGCLSFGGPAGQIALMHREIVDERKWLSEQQFLSALNFCMLLPGPEAMQLATYSGWRLHGVKGGLVAGLLFVLPGALVVLALSMLYAAFGNLPWIEAIFFGVKAAVLAIVIEALLRVARRALKGTLDWLIAGAGLPRALLFRCALPAHHHRCRPRGLPPQQRGRHVTGNPAAKLHHIVFDLGNLGRHLARAACTPRNHLGHGSRADQNRHLLFSSLPW